MPDIEIRLASMAQLYDSLDPSPFRAKALDRQAEAYLLQTVAEHASNAALRVLVHGPESMAAHVDDIATAIHSNFTLSWELADRRYRRKRRIGRIGLFLGLLVLGLALFARNWIAQWPGTLGEVLAEGLLVLGWVALWRPAENALYDRWEAREELNVLKRLSSVSVIFRASQPPSAPAIRPA